MNLSQIKKMFNKDMDIPVFRASIEDEVIIYENQLQKKGSSVPVVLIEDSILEFDISNLNYLRILLERKELTRIEISYICDAILLSNLTKFEDEDFIREELESLVLG